MNDPEKSPLNDALDNHLDKVKKIWANAEGIADEKKDALSITYLADAIDAFAPGVEIHMDAEI